MKAQKIKPPIKLDEYEATLEDNLDKAKVLKQKEKKKHLAAIKRATEQYLKKNK